MDLITSKQVALAVMAARVKLPSKTATRILTLNPGVSEEPISASLQVVDLAKVHAPYEAISYTWGPEGDEESITVDDVSVQVRKNLYEGLLRLRSPSEPRNLWCDYLCITQTDLVEKSQQVQIIGRIFGSANTVLVWLGEHANESEQLFHQWDQPTEPESIFKSWKQTLAPDDRRKAQKAAKKEAANQRAWQWVHFWQRSYWRRTWIIQELRLAQKIIVHVGTDSMAWTDLITARFSDMGMYATFDGVSGGGLLSKQDLDDPHELLDAYLSWQSRFVPVPHKEFQKAPGHVIMDEWEGQYDDIFSLVGIFKHSFCKDKRDKVFALHALERPKTSHKPVKVDYTLSLPEVVLALLEDRYVNLPVRPDRHKKVKSALQRFGISGKTVESAIEGFSAIDPSKGVPNLQHLLETLNFKLEDCQKVAKLAIEKSHEADEPQARRYKRVSEAIIGQYKKAAEDAQTWAEQKARWDAGKRLDLTMTHAPPSFNEDKFWHVHAKHIKQV